MANDRSAHRWHVESPHSVWAQRWMARVISAWEWLIVDPSPRLYMSSGWLRKHDATPAKSLQWKLRRRARKWTAAINKRVTARARRSA